MNQSVKIIVKEFCKAYSKGTSIHSTGWQKIQFSHIRKQVGQHRLSCIQVDVTAEQHSGAYSGIIPGGMDCMVGCFCSAALLAYLNAQG